MNGINLKSADARQLLAAGHVQNPACANCAFQKDHRRTFIRHFANRTGTNANWICAQDLQRALRIFRRNERGNPAFARDLKRIESENFARGVNVFANRNSFFLDQQSPVRRLGDFVQRARQTAARQIAQAMNFNSRLQQFQNHFVNRRGIAFDFALKFQSFAHGHNRHAMTAHVAADENHVASLHILRRNCPDRVQ